MLSPEEVAPKSASNGAGGVVGAAEVWAIVSLEVSLVFVVGAVLQPIASERVRREMIERMLVWVRMGCIPFWEGRAVQVLTYSQTLIVPMVCKLFCAVVVVVRR